VGFVVDKAPLGQVSSEYFGFPCESLYRLLHSHHHHHHHHHHPLSGTGTIVQRVADVPSGLSLTPPQETKKIAIVVVVIVYKTSLDTRSQVKDLIVSSELPWERGGSQPPGDKSAITSPHITATTSHSHESLPSHLEAN
jgi:hypothetical protein